MDRSGLEQLSIDNFFNKWSKFTVLLLRGIQQIQNPFDFLILMVSLREREKEKGNGKRREKRTILCLAQALW